MKFRLYGLAFTFIISSFSCTNNDDSADSSFTKISQGRFGGSENEYFCSSTSTSDGGQIILARTTSYDGDIIPTFPDLQYNVDIWIIKLNSQCRIEWKKTYGGTNTEDAYKIIQTNDGGYLFSVETHSTDGDFLPVDMNSALPPNNCLLVKINALGIIQWQKIISNFDWVQDIIQTQDGGYLCNNFFSLNKLDVNGNVVWTKSLDFYCYNILQLPDENIILSGNTSPSESHNINGIIAKTDLNGNILWKNSYERTSPSKVILSNDGGLLAVGKTNNKNVPNYHEFANAPTNSPLYDAWISKLDLSGNLEWQKAFGETNGQETIENIVSLNNEYIIGGTALSTVTGLKKNDGNGDYWIFKIDNLGNLITQKTFGGSGVDVLKNISLGKNNNIYLSGFIDNDSNDGDLKNTNTHGDFNTDIWTLSVKIN